MAAQYPHSRDPGNSLGRHYSNFQPIWLSGLIPLRPGLQNVVTNGVYLC